jgi:hypothetical protein
MKIGKRLVAAAGIAFMAGCAGAGTGAGAGIVKGSGPLAFQPKDFPGNNQCRIWDPAKPSEAQLESASCEQITNQIPPQGWLLRKANSDTVYVYSYSAGKVVATHEYDAHTAAYLGTR